MNDETTRHRTYEFTTGMIDMRDLLRIWLEKTDGNPEASIEAVSSYGDSMVLEMEWEVPPPTPEQAAATLKEITLKITEELVPKIRVQLAKEIIGNTAWKNCNQKDQG